MNTRKEFKLLIAAIIIIIAVLAVFFQSSAKADVDPYYYTAEGQLHEQIHAELKGIHRELETMNGRISNIRSSESENSEELLTVLKKINRKL